MAYVSIFGKTSFYRIFQTGFNFYWPITDIWQASGQHCCCGACQMSKWYDYLNYQSHNFQTLRNLEINILSDTETGPSVRSIAFRQLTRNLMFINTFKFLSFPDSKGITPSVQHMQPRNKCSFWWHCKFWQKSASDAPDWVFMDSHIIHW